MSVDSFPEDAEILCLRASPPFIIKENLQPNEERRDIEQFCRRRGKCHESYAGGMNLRANRCL
jgi:hypothetical protein